MRASNVNKAKMTYHKNMYLRYALQQNQSNILNFTKRECKSIKNADKDNKLENDEFMSYVEFNVPRKLLQTYTKHAIKANSVLLICDPIIKFLKLLISFLTKTAYYYMLPYKIVLKDLLLYINICTNVNFK